jgi:2-oxoglutarate dehydrogenase E2 component (dihydrolipoamide succinyltransferase)
MIIEIKVPSPGESVTEVEIGKWLTENGSLVQKGVEIAEVESDKATLTIVADESGKLSILVQEGESVQVGSVVATIDTEAVKDGEAGISSPQAQSSDSTQDEKLQKEGQVEKPVEKGETANLRISAVAKEIMKENHLSVDDLISGLKRIGRKEVEQVLKTDQAIPTQLKTSGKPSREQAREKMSVLRRKLSERLVAVKNETAMLTTFNEVDMTSVMEIRNLYQQKFVEKHGFKLGFMGFFAKAVAVAVQFHPSVNSMIEGEEIISPQYVDVGIAVQTPKGLMVPVVRNAESKSVPQIELEIKELAEKARNKKISMEELSGGTISITNGGVFGSLLSTPILNPPQSAILGMHNIVERPVAIKGKVEIRPMMYIALSYDHRVIDGKDSVGFLVRVKEMIENPQRMLAQGKDPVELLLEV